MSSPRVKYQTIEFDNTDIHVRSLRDNQEFSDDDGIAEALGISSASWPLFGVLWDSGLVLAHQINTREFVGKRILEVGCGLALASLLLNHRKADITVTDYHPEVGAFLDVNTELNGDPNIPFYRVGWADAANDMGKFDIIIGSDLLYEAEHIELLAAFLNQHASEQCEIILIDPGRGNHAKFSKRMTHLGWVHTQARPIECDYTVKPFKGQVLNYQR
ncbi:class I SAM-dependent methyltransferase [Neptunomonas phycophila]|uniref:class I SAM-dependent methyltransferase n=1 Tax=Neptunomonas phycophila TaxID=1572645 RepID=UPI0009490AA0|nr:methyltransferase domain-containing protein [Neptunomonas phycophila]